jgi:hypothetical protein
VTSSKNNFGQSTALRGATCALGTVTLTLALAAGALGATFLDDVDRGKAAVAASGATSVQSAAARAAAVQNVVQKDGKASPAFTSGAALAVLDLDLESDPATHQRGDRAVIEQQVRDLLQAQAESKIGNRALCLLSGRSNPRSLEGQVRLVEPNWSCGPLNHH